MDATLQENKTVPSVGYLENFFQSLPTDQRFNCVSFRKFAPITAVTKNASTISFEFPRLDDPHVYLLNQTMIRVQCIIEKAADGVPETDCRVSPINLILHTMWEKVSMSINDKEITKQSSFYGYKCYMINKLSFGTDAKNSFLMTSNWDDDTPGHYEAIPDNDGFLARSEAFRQSRSNAQPFKSEGAVFMGRLQHDLVDSKVPLPPNTKINFNFEKAKDAFCLMRGKKSSGNKPSDPEEYKLSLLNVSLYVPVAVLSTPMYNAILSRWPSEPIIYHYRPMCVTLHTIGINTSQFISPALFPDSENPVRVTLVVVPTIAQIGSYNSNPFQVNLIYFAYFVIKKKFFK